MGVGGQSTETTARTEEKYTDRKRKSTPGYIGVESIQYFYEKYRNFERDKQHQSEEDSKSATSAYLTEISNMKLLPTPSGLISSKGIEGELNARNLKLGKHYALAISKSMRHM